MSSPLVIAKTERAQAPRAVNCGADDGSPPDTHDLPLANGYRGWRGRIRVRWAYPPGKRDLRLDLLRGFAVFAMVVDHVGGDQSWLARITGGDVFFTSAAEAFVFISGVVMGIVYGKAIARQGIWAGVKMTFRRAWRLYILTVTLTLLYFVFSYNLQLPWAEQLTPADVPGFVIGVLTLHRTYYFTDVLLLYTLLVFAASGVLAALASGYTWPVLAGSWTLWLLWQRWPDQAQVPWTIADNNLFQFPAWQALFVTGIVIGCRQQAITGSVRRISGGIVLGASGALAGAAVVFYRYQPAILIRLGWTGDPHALDELLFDKGNLRVGRLVVFGAFAVFAFTLLTIEWVPISRLTGWLLLPLGQHALLAYTLHLIVLGLALTALSRLGGSETPGQSVTAAVQLGSVGLVWATIMAWTSAAPRLWSLVRCVIPVGASHDWRACLAPLEHAFRRHP